MATFLIFISNIPIECASVSGFLLRNSLLDHLAFDMGGHLSGAHAFRFFWSSFSFPVLDKKFPFSLHFFDD